MAVEAVKQVSKPVGETCAGYLLRKVEILRALIVPDTDDGIEVQLTLNPCPDSELDGRGWWIFHVYSITHLDSVWTEHSRGFIAVKQQTPGLGEGNDDCGTSLFNDRWSTAEPLTWSRRDAEEVFAKLRASGIVHGPLFRNLLDIRVSEPQSSTTFWIQDCRSADRDEPSELVVHPTTLDSIFQAAYPALEPDALDGCMVLPRSIEQMYISAHIPRAASSLLEARAEVSIHGRRGFSSTLSILDSDSAGHEPVARITGLFCQAVPMAAVGERKDTSRTCFEMIWRPDWTFLPSTELKKPVTFSADLASVEMGNKLVRATYHFIHDTLSKLSAQDVQALDWHQHRLLDWMRIQDRLGSEDGLANNSSSWAKSSAGIKQLLFDEVSTASVNGRLLCRIGSSLLDILRNEAAPLELMMEGNLLYDFYDNSLRTARSGAQVEHLVAHHAHKTPHGRILEIGAGTGSCTTRVLRALSSNGASRAPLLSHYDFTDISSGFFEQAREKYAAWGDFISYQKLDIESDPATQGFELESYDLVVACLVLHATKDLERTLANVRRMMKPGAKLILVETTRDTIDSQLFFGTLPGWWLGKDRVDSPNISAEEWHKVLVGTGFSGVDAELRDFDDDDEYSISTMLITAVPQRRYPETLTIVTADTTPQRWTQDFAELLKSQTDVEVAIKSLGSIQGDQHCIFLLEAEQPLLASIDKETFAQVHEALNNVQSALWITNGNIAQGGNPDYALHAGLLRTLRLEDPRKRLVACDLASAEDPWTETNTSILVTLLKDTFNLEQPPGEIDTEYAIRDSQIHIARVYEDMLANDATRALSKATEPCLQAFGNRKIPLRIEIGTPGLIDSLVFVEDQAMSEPLPADYIEIEPKAFGLNFRDVLCALGHIDGNTLGFECSGIVTSLGSNARQSDLRVGDRVCTLMLGHFGTKVRVHWTWAARIPETASLEEAATIPLVYATAYQALEVCARLQEGETVLIHAASGGVGQAAIMMAQLKNARIFATVGTEAKKQFIHETYGIPLADIFSSRNDSFASAVMAKTNGAGVDVVLNSLAGNLLKASWESIASFGRFIEIGRRDIEQDKALSMLPFGRVTSFATVDLNYLVRLRPNKVKETMDAIMLLWRAREIRAVAPVTQFSMSEITGAFRLMQSGKHLGKIILSPQPGDEVQVLPSVKHFEPAQNASYLIVGGLGGIGQSLARHLASIGCQHLIVLSRSATQHSVNSLCLELEARGCTLSIRDCDVSDAQMLDATIDDLRRSGVPPIRGIIQAAMVLHDSIFETMDHKKWHAALKPKIAATWNLHNAFKEVDFFVMLASIAGVAGSPGQSNYAAGSAFQDAFARYRAQRHLPAVSIDLGSVSNVGHAAKTDGVIERLQTLGFEPIEESQTLRIIEMAMCSPTRSIDSSQLITGFTLWDDSMNVAWAPDHRYWSLKRNSARGHRHNELESSKTGAQSDVREAVAAAKTWEEACQYCLDALMAKIKTIFALSDDAVDPVRPLSDYGVDSLVAVEVRNWLALSLQADVSIFDIMQSGSLQVLAEKTVERSQLVGDKGLKKAVVVAE
ncbi:hypothetical protein PRZ48_002501 [Zasmidium cellare]|uniref:Polyketide synthase n=1 Tax=Zasmidium cellare TaxID=395010 RepID=A0ABR0F500_ZASCE|nr:hypothetical protein PRZ48_002501 [Zasmidium cellare]